MILHGAPATTGAPFVDATPPPMAEALQTERIKNTGLRLRFRREWTAWLTMPVLLVFPILFVLTVVPRLWLPFNLEWNEAQTAEQALRFAMGEPLYPASPDEWVPYMYAPLYHMLMGALFKLTGVYHLGWGRLLSIAGTLLAVQSIFMIVYDRTRRFVPAAIAALLFFAYFKPTGYWYDIARLDALAFGLGAFGMYHTLRRRPTTLHLWIGLVALTLATLTKQTMGPVAIFCGFWLLATNRQKAAAPIVFTAVVALNFVLLFEAAGNEWFFKYAVTNAQRHLSNWGVAIPGFKYPPEFFTGATDPTSFLSKAKFYLTESIRNPPELWKVFGRHVALFWAWIALWPIAALARRQWPRGWMYAVPFVLLTVASIAGLAKSGGYINNMLPAYLLTCVLLGFAFEGIRRAFPERWRLLPDLAFALVVLLQVTQPWYVPRPSMPREEYGRLRWEAIRAEPDRQLRDAMSEYFGIMDGYRKADPKPEAVSRYNFLKWVSAGLFWLPSHQQPAPGSLEAHREFIRWLQAKKLAGEDVWVLHHQFYGWQTGHPTGLNVDMVRCAGYAGDPQPKRMTESFTDGTYEWLVLDYGLPHEWLPSGIHQVIERHYDPMGVLPPLQGKDAERILQPVTGALVRPFFLYRRKGFDGSPQIAPPAAAGS